MIDPTGTYFNGQARSVIHETIDYPKNTLPPVLSIIFRSYEASKVVYTNESCYTSPLYSSTLEIPLGITVTEGLSNYGLSSSAASALTSFVGVERCFAIAHIQMPSVTPTPGNSKMIRATPADSSMVNIPSAITTLKNTSLTGPAVQGKDRRGTIRIVFSTVFSVVGFHAITADTLLIRRRRRGLCLRKVKDEDSDNDGTSPFLQTKAELDSEQQRYEMEAMQRQPCELEGQCSRQEMMTRADEEVPEHWILQELICVEPSCELDTDKSSDDGQRTTNAKNNQ